MSLGSPGFFCVQSQACWERIVSHKMTGSTTLTLMTESKSFFSSFCLIWFCSFGWSHGEGKRKSTRHGLCSATANEASWQYTKNFTLNFWQLRWFFSQISSQFVAEICISLKALSLFFLGGARDGTQCLMHTRQVPCPWAIPLTPALSSLQLSIFNQYSELLCWNMQGNTEYSLYSHGAS